MFFLKNLSSQQIHRGVLPWEFVPAVPIPVEIRTDKEERNAWINRPTTEHQVYTFHEGVNNNLRISKARTDGEGNPVHACHSLVADYDSKQPEELVLKFARELPYPPNWIERTLSGNWRFVWLLEEPLIFPSYDFAKHFYKTFAEFGFDPNAGMIGFDRGAWEAPERLWTNSCDWRALSDKTIPADVSRGWLVKAGQKFKFNGSDFGIEVPLDVIIPELTAQYPKFSQWPGPFTVNSTGPTFWVEASQSPKSATVRETGIQTFSANAAKGFYSWKDLLGAAFVQRYEAEALGRTVEGIHFDGREYYRKTPDGLWNPSEKADLALHLRVDRHVSPKADKTGVSAIDRAIAYIQNFQRVQGCAPFVFHPPGIIVRNTRRFLNTSRVAVLAPADGPTVWGPKGQFPWLSAFLERFLDAAQLAILLAWVAWAYKGYYVHQPTSGQVLFLAGGVGVGKTLLNRAILGRLFGGIAEAKEFLLGEDNFNSELFDAGFWAVDDASVSSDARKLRVFGEMLKRVAANPTFRCNEKFRKASLSEWQGRLGVTCNADEESTVIIPDLSNSILDKLILLRTFSKDKNFPGQYELQAILEKELPFFARWLLDHEIPAELRGDARFGVIHYAEPSLVETARLSSRTAGFAEILEDWKDEYFTKRDLKAEYWEGSASQLYKQILLDPTAEPLMRHYTVESIARYLTALKAKGAHLEPISRGETRFWRIYRGDKTPSPQTKT